MSEPVNIKILDREFTVGCEPEERDGLLAAANLLDSRMREIREMFHRVVYSRQKDKAPAGQDA